MPPSRSLGPVSRQALHQRKVDAVLSDERIDLPAPDASWLPATRAAYSAYADADVARLLRAEDVPQVVDLFANLDRLALVDAALDAALASDAPIRVVDEHIRAKRGLAALIRDARRDLGIGPRNRVDLGILEAQGVKAAAEVDEFLADA